MKKTFFSLWLCCTVFVASQSVQAQTAVALSCNSLRCPDMNVLQTNVFIACNAAPGSSTCSLYTICSPKSREFKLVRKNGSSWDIHSDWQPSTNQYDNLPKGIYKILIRTPVPRPESSCSNGFRRVYDFFNSQHIGEGGQWEYVETNELVMGAADASDNVWNFIDPNGNNLFNMGQPVLMNTSQVRHYTGWWLALWEVDGNGNLTGWATPGWRNDPIPAQIDLSTPEYLNSFGGSFKPLGHSYYVQFAIATGCNQSWVANDKWLYVCPPGWNCSGQDGSKGLAVSPNPVNNVFSIKNLNMENAENTEIQVTDMTGRRVKTFQDVQSNQFDVSDLTTGMYIATISVGGKSIQKMKLMVSK